MHILIFPPTLLKSSLDIRTPHNPKIGNFIVVLNPTMVNMSQTNQVRPLQNQQLTTIGSMNIIIWNCRGCNWVDFRSNFRVLLDWHKPPLVALTETKMQSHQVLLDDFSFTSMIEVSVVGNSGGSVVLWDDSLLELYNISTTHQEIHAMIKGSYSPTKEPPN